MNFPPTIKEPKNTHALATTSAFNLKLCHKSICPSVCLSVCLCVCSLLGYRLNVFLPPLPEFGCLIFLEIWNPWGKVVKRSGVRFEHFGLKVV